MKDSTKRLLFSLLFLAMLVVSLPFLIEYWIHGTTVNGPSMYPTWKIGRTVIFLDYNVPESNLTGKIVSFRACPEYYTVHRVISDNGTHVQTRGDNPETNKVPDNSISRTQIHGVVYKWSPFWLLVVNYILLFAGLVGVIAIIGFWKWLLE